MAKKSDFKTVETSQEELEEIKKYVINPVESREAQNISADYYYGGAACTCGDRHSALVATAQLYLF